MSEDNAVIPFDARKPTDLAVSLTEKAIEALGNQRAQLRAFVSSQLIEGLGGDYAEIPGTKKKSLLKPGAEKLANIFQLGSRIVSVDREVDHKEGFAMFTYTIEMFHIPSGKAISQCQGSANSFEPSHKNKAFAQALNAIQKIAQKRAYVGAVIIAVGASDFFTQDMEDDEGGRPGPTRVKASIPKATSAKSKSESDAPTCCEKPMMASKYHENTWYCVSCKGTKAM